MSHCPLVTQLFSFKAPVCGIQWHLEMADTVEEDPLYILKVIVRDTQTRILHYHFV